MRRFDKTKNIQKANLLAEQRYLQSKGIIKENMVDESDLYEAERVSMSEFFGDVTDNVDTLLKMFSKYKPNNSWFMTVGYVNNVSSSSLPVNINPENLAGFEEIAAKLDNPKLKRYLDSMIGSDEWTSVKNKYAVDQERAARGLKTKSPGKATYTNPYAGRKYKDSETKEDITIPSKVYSTKSFTIQWNNVKTKADRDAEITALRAKHGITGDEGSIDTDDMRGRGYERVPGTPFKQHQGTKNTMIDFYAKGGVKSHKSKFFINFEGDIAELTPEETNFIFANSKSKESGMPKRLADMANQEAAREIWNMESLYEFKNFNLDNIFYINCTMNIDGDNKKFSYINKNAVPSGLNQGEFSEFIEASLPKSNAVNEGPIMGIYENVDDKTLIDAIEGLEDADIGWSNNPNKGLSIAFDWDNVDEDLLLTQILNLIKKVNPNADLGKKKQSLVDTKSNILANFNSKLYSASQRSFSAFRGLKDYFIDNLEIFK